MRAGDIIKDPDYQGGPYRIVACDEYVVCTEPWEGDSSYEYRQKMRRKKPNFSHVLTRSSSEYVLKMCRVEGHVELTDVEFNLYRPDLPLRLFPTYKWRWGKTEHSDMDAFIADFSKEKMDFQSDQEIDLSEVTLVPRRKNAGDLSPFRKCQSRGTGFTAAELYWHASQVQPDVGASGCAFHRDGVRKGAIAYHMTSVTGFAEYYPAALE
jgi:hypothetical protein